MRENNQIMNKKYSSLDEILNDGEFGDIFKVKPKNKNVSANDTLINSFNEINNFYAKHNREPSPLQKVPERILAKRLEEIRNNQEKIEILKSFDQHNLLQIEIKPLQSLDDILKDDFISTILFDDSTSHDIFNLKNVPSISTRQESDLISRRKVCKNFDKYEPLFKLCQQDLKLGKRKLIPFEEKNLTENSFFVLNGQLGYLEYFTAPVKRGGNRHDGRTYWKPLQYRLKIYSYKFLVNFLCYFSKISIFN